MKEPINKIDRALDRAVFGTNDPTKIEKKLDKMKQYLELEASSLGHSLAGIRHRNYQTFEKVAKQAGVPVETWRSWESDLCTPSAQELAVVLKKLHWSWDLARFLALRDKASEARLRRLVNLSPSTLAASGLAGASAPYEWHSLGEEVKERLGAWAAGRNLQLPDDLAQVLSELHSDEERQAWIEEVLHCGSDR